MYATDVPGTLQDDGARLGGKRPNGTGFGS